MQDQNNYRQINWIDGMKINKDHFIGLENYFISYLSDVIKMFSDSYSYGLLPLPANGEKNVKFELSLDDQNILKVKLSRCCAITPSGHWINISEIDESNYAFDMVLETAVKTTDFQEGEYYLIISVNPYVRIPTGRADSSENPLRQPFIVPQYKLSVVPTTFNLSKGLNTDSLPIGKIAFVNNKPEINPNYIPPSICVSSHEKLIKFYSFINQSTNTLEKNVVELIAEINQKTTSNVLINIISFITKSLFNFLNSKIAELKWLLETKPPVYLIIFVISLARTVKNAFDTRTPEEKEKLLNYFSEHFDINPAKFKQLLDNTINMDYQHTDISQSLVKAEDFINVISLLFNELKKMEFIIGEKKKKKIDIIIR